MQIKSMGFEFSIEAFGTFLNIRILENIQPLLQIKIKEEILNYTLDFDQKYSRFIKNSLVCEISKKSSVYKVPKDLVTMLQIYFDFYTITDKKMNPLVGKSLEDLGYDPDYTLVPRKVVSTVPELNEAIKIIDDSTINVIEPILIDIGALGKGYWGDKVSEILLKNNIFNFIIDGSGDILQKTNRQENIEVSLEYPEDANLPLQKSTKIENESICGSGTNKRNWSLKNDDNLHHILDATTGKPTENILSVWVKHKNATFADALATALFLVEPEILLEKYKFEYLIIYKQKKILTSYKVSENFF